MYTVAQTPYACNNGHATPAALPQEPSTPEALCSMNGFVKIGRAETRNHQVTGRGATPEEAAANFFGCLDALEAGYAARAQCETPPAAPAPPSREARLAQLLTCGLQRAVTKGDMGLVERLSKAAALVLSGAVEPTERAQALAVRSQAHPDTWYTVEGLCCSCPDWGKHRAEETPYHCKHLLAAWLHKKLDVVHSVILLP